MKNETVKACLSQSSRTLMAANADAYNTLYQAATAIERGESPTRFIKSIHSRHEIIDDLLGVIDPL